MLVHRMKFRVSLLLFFSNFPIDSLVNGSNGMIEKDRESGNTAYVDTFSFFALSCIRLYDNLR